MTVVDTRTPSQRSEDERDKLRRPLEWVLDWIGDDVMRPSPLTVEDCLPLVAKHVGHPVEAATVTKAIAAINARDRYVGSEAEIERREANADAALDELLDLVDCDDCHDLHPADEVRTCDHGTFGVGDHPDCFTAFHSGNFCPSVDER